MKGKIIGITTSIFFAVFLLAGMAITYFEKSLLKDILTKSLGSSDNTNNIISQFSYESVKTITVTVFICAVIALLIFIAFFSRLFKSIETFKEDLSEISEGQLSVRVKEHGNLGELAKSVNYIVKNTKKILCEIYEVSQKNRDLSSTLQENIKYTEEASSEIAQSISAITESTYKQSQDATSTGESTKQMAENAEKIAKNAKDTKSIAEEMIEVIKVNGELFNNIIDKMKTTGEVSTKLAGNVRMLQGEADQINNIASVVTELSEKTNLLALNAAIEAARAGEHGKGFSVVAEEVRKLSEQSSSSASEIRKLIEDINRRINEITSEAISQVKDINEDIQFADKSKDSFTKIKESTESTYRAIEEIHQIANETSHMADNVYELVNNIVYSTQEALSFTQEVSAGADEQANSIQQITSLINKTNKTADDIDIKLKEFINNIRVGEKEKRIVEEGFGKLKGIAQQINSKSLSLDNASQFLREQVKVNEQFEYIGLLNSEGIMKSANEAISKENNDFSFRPYFKEAILGKEYYTEPYISNVSFNYCIAIAVPFRDMNGQIKGVIMADVCIEK